MKPRIYLDNNGSTPLDPAVIEVIKKTLHSGIGNPSSIHSFGRESKNLLIQSRDEIAKFLQVKSNEIVFTSGGTEGANMVIRGLLSEKKKGHVITSNVEHACVYATLKAMELLGFEVSFLPVGLQGAVEPEAVRSAIRSDTTLIAFMAVNNETGVKTDIEAIAAIAEASSIPFFVDGVALLGKELFMIPSGVSACCFSGHKFHAPKGIGFNFIRRQLKLQPLISGGLQEYGRRGGTENLLGIVAMAEAIRLLTQVLPACSQKMEELRNRLEVGILHSLGNVKINGEGPRVVNTTNLAFEGIEGESLLTTLDIAGIAVSHGSACASGGLEPSRILLNMGMPIERARSSLRFSLSRLTTIEEIDQAIEIVVKVVKQMRQTSRKPRS